MALATPMTSTRGLLLAGLGWIAVLVSGCSPWDDSPLLTLEQSVIGGDSEALTLKVESAGGLVEVLGGAEAQLEALFEFDNERMRPQLRQRVEGERLSVDIDQPDFGGPTRRSRNYWHLGLGVQRPVDLQVSLGIGEIRCLPGFTPLENLNLHVGTGDMIVDLSRVALSEEGLKGVLDVGNGQIVLRLPPKAGIRLRTKVVAGDVQALGLDEKDGTFVNAAWSEGQQDLDLVVTGGISVVTVELGF